MKEIIYSAKIQDQQISSNEKGVGPETDKLKYKFKEGSIPLQIDFSQLIDIADIGRKACGQAPQQNGPGAGLKLGDDGTLNLKMGTFDHRNSAPLILEEDILSVRLGSGLTNNRSDGISIGQGHGITVHTNSIAVKVAANKGLVVDGNGIAIKTGSGIKLNSDGELEAASADSSITVDSSGIKVKAGKGIKVGDGLEVHLHTDGGIGNSSSGIRVKTGNGIKIDDDRITIDPNTVLPKGMITMFSGSAIPQGWALCDGTKGTPDLIDRFILGGTLEDIGGKSSKSAAGQKNSKFFIVNSKENATEIMDVRVNETKLNIKQIPKHKHIQGGGFTQNTGLRYSAVLNNDLNDEINNNDLSGYRIIYNSTEEQWIRTVNYDHWWPYTSSVGSSEGHGHTASATLPSHTHQVNTVSPYYILAFIMKL
ncbi:tail fiber protein [Xenorhabdus sp. PB61.4]|uniref:tail fiber protein n=1 Tax=Xenorhabdus sp. PB61.4 TaxID=2788940 RepID=UPI001E4AA15C|nr:tail fiber protein [Xenorhabdus sp. PB61.4]MCC8366143.1 tail fiber protein [Xenorhabdus sp. PB61.4]